MRVSPNKPRSAKQIAVSRANGARLRNHHILPARAPRPRRTPRHQELARTVVLQDESSERFCELLRALEATYLPESELETLLVESMAVTKWMQLRAVTAHMRDGNRVEADCERQYDRGLARLLELQSNRF
jgi:hypothetical protein